MLDTSHAQLRIRFITSPEYTHKVFDIIEELLDVVVMDKDQRHEFIIGLGEALDNAIVHGNKLDPNKFVEVSCRVDKEKISCTIVDEGEGFAYQSYLSVPMSEYDPQVLIRKATQGKLKALGLGLIRKCMDEVVFNETGNQVTLVKHLAPALTTEVR